MRILEARNILAAWSPERRREVFDVDCTVTLPNGETDCWPDAAVGAVICTGWLPSLESEADLEAALRQFQLLHGSGDIIDAGLWEKQTENVIRELIDWGDRQAAADPVGCN